MRVNVLYFGVLQEMFGRGDESVDLPVGVTVADLLHILRVRTSNQVMAGNSNGVQEDRLWMSLAVAVNREYSAPDAVLGDGNEVALLPPVSGGCCAEGEGPVGLKKYEAQA